MKRIFKRPTFQDSFVPFLLLIAMFSLGFILSSEINDNYEKNRIRQEFSNQLLELKGEMRVYENMPSTDSLEELEESISSLYTFISEHTPQELELAKEKCLSMREFFCSLHDVAILATYCPEYRDLLMQIIGLTYGVLESGDVDYPDESMNFCNNYDLTDAEAIIDKIKKELTS